MTRKRLYIETVGCQMNVLDSELVVGTLRRQGYELAHSAADADVIFFNTCSVREHAEDKVYSALGRVQHLKRRNPDTVIGVLGCMAQKDQDLIRRRAPYVDMVVGNDSGPAHIACSVGTPVVTVIHHSLDGDPAHRSSPTRFGPWGVPHRILRPAHSTSPGSAAR